MAQTSPRRARAAGSVRSPPVSAELGTQVPVQRVSTLELFFDLVFVFTVTQLTAVLTHDLSLQSFGQVVVMLTLI